MSWFRKKEKNKSWKKRNPRVYSGVPKREKQEKRGKFTRFLFWVLFLGFLGVSGYLLFFSPFMEIEAVSVEGNRDIPTEEITGKIEQALSGKYYNLVSKRNFFFASKYEINNKLKNSFDRLEVSAIEKKFPRAILVKVQERQPEMAWCSGGVCYLVDKSGLVYAGANAADEELNKNRFLIAVDDNARPVEIKKTTVNPEFIQCLKKIDSLLIEDLGLALEGNYHTPAISSGEIVVKIKEGDTGWILKISSAVLPGEIKKIIGTIFEKDLNAEKRKNLEYLDLRVKGKVYYKMR